MRLIPDLDVKGFLAHSVVIAGACGLLLSLLGTTGCEREQSAPESAGDGDVPRSVRGEAELVQPERQAAVFVVDSLIYLMEYNFCQGGCDTVFYNPAWYADPILFESEQAGMLAGVEAYHRGEFPYLRQKAHLFADTGAVQDAMADDAAFFQSMVAFTEHRHQYWAAALEKRLDEAPEGGVCTPQMLAARDSVLNRYLRFTCPLDTLR